MRHQRGRKASSIWSIVGFPSLKTMETGRLVAAFPSLTEKQKPFGLFGFFRLEIVSLCLIAALSCRCWLARWRAFMAAAFCYRPFLLTGKDQRVKADIIGPYAQSGRFPAMSARPARPTQPVFDNPTHGIMVGNNTATDNTPTSCRHRGPRPTISYAFGTHSYLHFAS